MKWTFYSIIHSFICSFTTNYQIVDLFFFFFFFFAVIFFSWSNNHIINWNTQSFMHATTFYYTQKCEKYVVMHGKNSTCQLKLIVQWEVRKALTWLLWVVNKSPRASRFTLFHVWKKYVITIDKNVTFLVKCVMNYLLVI